jgi:hypothetical protein
MKAACTCLLKEGGRVFISSLCLSDILRTKLWLLPYICKCVSIISLIIYTAVSSSIMCVAALLSLQSSTILLN